MGPYRRAVLIPVRCRWMVSSFALVWALMGSVMCQQIGGLSQQQPDGPFTCFGESFVIGQRDVPAKRRRLRQSQRVGIILADGHLVCFGDKSFGKCDVPTNLGPVLAVSAGFQHTCAVRADGHLVCFGCNDSGQCGVPDC